MIAPQPSSEFNVKLIKPFSGTATHTVEIIGQPNGPATVKLTNTSNAGNSLEKTGQMPADDVKELMEMVQQVRGFPSDENKDLFGLDTRLELQTFEIQWTNVDEPVDADVTVGDETKQTFKDVTDSIDAAGRQFAKQDAAI